MTQVSKRRRRRRMLPEVCFKDFELILKGSWYHSE
jgi:hypothetical protein